MLCTLTDGEPRGQFKTFPSIRFPQISYIAQYSSECLSLHDKVKQKQKQNIRQDTKYMIKKEKDYLQSQNGIQLD